MSFGTALTGLNAASADLDVTGNNLANSQTIGFKSSRAEFVDIFAVSKTGLPRLAIGQGTRLAAVTQQFTQGQMSFTGNVLDLGITDNGFFRLNDGGNVVYGRAGAFQLDREGYIVDSSNRRLTGRSVDSTQPWSDLRVNIGDVPPQQSNNMEISANLKSGSEPPVSAPFTPEDPDSFNYSTSTMVYDSLGGAHQITYYFIKNDLADDPAGEAGWTVRAQVGDTLLDEETPLSFSDATGKLTANAVQSYDLTGIMSRNTADGDSASLTVDFSDLTQYGTPFGVTRLSPDGYPPGQFTDLTIETNGVIFARYSNGQSSEIGQVMLSQFNSPENLQAVGDSVWIETHASGKPITDVPGSSGMGEIRSGALELSNVNVSEQLVNMIIAQRAYQANAKMISTQDQITQEVLNIR